MNTFQKNKLERHNLNMYFYRNGTYNQTPMSLDEKRTPTQMYWGGGPL
jgi:hypothetical protein